MTTIAVLAIAATSASATPKGGTPPPFQGGGDSTATAAALAAQAQGQIQGQAQGQNQGQSLYNTNKIGVGVDVDNSNRNSNSNRNYNTASGGDALSLSGSIAGAASNNNVQIEGDNIEGSVALAGLAMGSCSGGSVSAGAQGWGLGFSVSSTYCENLALAGAAELYGGSGVAHLCSTEASFARSQPALCNPRAAITNQTYDGGKAGSAMTVATRSAPITLYTTCEVIGNTPHITVPAGMGSDADYIDRAARACFATR